ncbi:hypothetical protein RJ639_004294 [Escallonia herrerae]|uniref:RING-type E3 ubiquitin transferase n=1 Tax=Escallonia herrerae TaxID=1293975 RepID=A0AA89AVL6_9ASTE|nr:hypothetical protein RJ639_004294 [Escallonia herrerae]
MQGQRRFLDSFPEAVDLNQGSISSNAGRENSTAWDNMLNPMESRLSNYVLSSGEGNFNCVNAVGHSAQRLSGWDLGESSSSANFQDQVSCDAVPMEHDWSSSFSACAGADAQFESSNILLQDSFNSGLAGNRVMGGSLNMQSSGSNYSPVSANLNSGYAGSSDDGGQGFRAGVCPTLYKSGRSFAEHTSSDDAAAGPSANPGYLVEDDGSDSSLGGWGYSCKRKALEGTSGQSYPGGSSSCFPEPENILRHTAIGRYNASSSLSISPSPVNSSVSRSEQLNSRIGVGMRGVTSDVFPHSNATETANFSRNRGARGYQVHQVSNPTRFPPLESAIRPSSVRSLNQPSRPLSLTDSMDFTPAASVTTNSINPSNQSHLTRVPGMPRNMLPFPWNAALNSRAGSSSGSLTNSGDRGAALRDEANFRSTHRNSVEHTMFVPPTETRNFVQDPTSWSLATGSSSTSGGVPSSSRIGPNTSSRTIPTVWLPHHNPPTQSQRLSEFAPWTLFPSIESDSGVQRGHFSPFASGPSSSANDTVTPSAANSQGRHHPYPRSALMMELLGEDINGWRALASDIEGRQRLVSELALLGHGVSFAPISDHHDFSNYFTECTSQNYCDRGTNFFFTIRNDISFSVLDWGEIRQVLNAMRRGENLRAEDYILFDPFINGVAELHDRHRDMRLDVDNMSYEELLALEERMGNVNTGLSEENIRESMKQRKYLSYKIGPLSKIEPCCICQVSATLLELNELNRVFPPFPAKKEMLKGNGDKRQYLFLNWAFPVAGGICYRR